MFSIVLLLWKVVTVHYFRYSQSQENITEYSQDTPTTAVPLLLAPILARLHETAMAMRVKLLESTLLNTLRLLQHAGCLNLLEKICEWYFFLLVIWRNQLQRKSTSQKLLKYASQWNNNQSLWTTYTVSSFLNSDSENLQNSPITVELEMEFFWLEPFQACDRVFLWVRRVLHINAICPQIFWVCGSFCVLWR